MLRLILTGLLCGSVNGLFGAGGGVVSVLFLERFCKLQKKNAHATTVAVILFLSLVSLVIYFMNSFVDIKVSVLAGLGGIAGGLLGARLLNKMPTKYIGKLFGVLMIASALGMFTR